MTSENKVKRLQSNNMTDFCPTCRKVYWQVGNFKPEDICQCDKT